MVAKLKTIKAMMLVNEVKITCANLILAFFFVILV
jgi:hypothetical protein